MKKIIILTIALSVYLNVASQEIYKRSYFGLYMRSDAKVMTNVVPTSVSYSKLDSYMPSLGEKPSMSIYIKGEYSENYTTNQQPEFFFFFPNDSLKSTSTNYISSMIRNYPFSYLKSPDQFTLVRLFRLSEKRAYRLEKKSSSSTDIQYKVWDIDTIPFTSIPISEFSYKVILNSKLPFGEYGFIYKNTSPYMDIVYDLSIIE